MLIRSQQFIEARRERNRARLANHRGQLPVRPEGTVLQGRVQIRRKFPVDL